MSFLTIKNYRLLFAAIIGISFTVIMACHNGGGEKKTVNRQVLLPDTGISQRNQDQPRVADTLPPLQCKRTLLTTVGNINVWKLEQGAIIFKAKMAIDADGSPRAYCPDNGGLDYTANAGSSGHWFGIITDSRGDPVIQQNTDPFPGCYVSPTTLSDGALPAGNPLKYCNSEAIPFIVLPKKVLDLGGIRIGDFAYVYNTKNKKSCFAIFADGGPAGKLGEGSVYLAEQLGINSNPRSGGTPDGIIYLVFPHSGKGNGYLRTVQEISHVGLQQLNKLGGPGVVACANL